VECGWACRHMYAVMNRGFLYTDVHVRFWTIYSRDYWPGQKGITDTLDGLRSDYDSVGGIPVVLSELTQSAIGGKTRNFFKSTIKIRGPCHWTQQVRYSITGQPIPPEIRCRSYGKPKPSLSVQVGVTTEVRLSQSHADLSQAEMSQQLDTVVEEDATPRSDDSDMEEIDAITDVAVDNVVVYNNVITDTIGDPY
jgi:hypothetical protein